MTRRFIGCIIVQQRASDGLKKSWTLHETREAGDRAVKQCREFMKSVQRYPHHRRRFCYRVNVYARQP